MVQVLTHTQKKWAERVARWEKSGLGCEEFAAKEVISAKRLSWWRWKLRQLGESLSEVAAPSLPSFVRLDVVESPPRIEHAEPLELVFNGGQRLRIPVGFDAETLSRVVSLLARSDA
jgi:hypothetical protein